MSNDTSEAVNAILGTTGPMSYSVGQVRDFLARAIMAERQHKAEIAVEIYRALERLTARSDLLGILGSYGDTQSDEWVLEQLRRYNDKLDAPYGRHNERNGE